MIEFCAVREKAYAYLMEDDSELKKAKGTKICVIKRELRFKDYKDSSFNDKIIIKSQQVFRSDHHGVCTVENNRTALSSNDDKRLQTYDKITTHPYGTPTIKVCELDILLNEKTKRLLCTIDQ